MACFSRSNEKVQAPPVPSPFAPSHTPFGVWPNCTLLSSFVVGFSLLKAPCAPRLHESLAPHYLLYWARRGLHLGSFVFSPLGSHPCLAASSTLHSFITLTHASVGRRTVFTSHPLRPAHTTMHPLDRSPSPFGNAFELLPLQPTHTATHPLDRSPSPFRNAFELLPLRPPTPPCIRWTAHRLPSGTHSSFFLCDRPHHHASVGPLTVSLRERA